jgi:hypothetical protein
VTPGVSLLVTLVLINTTLAIWQWQRRERQIRAAWQRLKSSLNLDASRPRIDRCIELLLAEYGLDTLSQPQMEEVPSVHTGGTGSAAHYALLAAGRWQITLPPLQFRLLDDQGHGFAGTFGSGHSWAANLTAGHESTDSLLQWSDVHEIQVASDILSDREALPVVVAHEVSHLVLERDGVDAGSIGENEVLTDVATALIGYGVLMRRLRSRERRYFGPGIQLSWSISGPGYLLPEELDYVLARQGQLMRGPQGGTAAPSEVAT